jgi:hypothetical protein
MQERVSSDIKVLCMVDFSKAKVAIRKALIV